MGKKMKKKTARRPLDDPAPAGATFGDLLRAKGLAPAASGHDAADAAAPAAPSPPAGELDLSQQGKIVMRRTRKGYGGKTVTEITGIDLPPADLAAMAKALRKALGCGGRVADGAIVLQGDLGPQADTWLRARGARRTVVC